MLWREEPPLADQRALHDAARRIGKWAHYAQRLELAVGALLLIILCAGLVIAPTPTALLAAAPFAAVLLWLSAKRLRLHRISQIVDNRSREAFLESLVIGATARVRRSRLNLLLLLPGYLLAALAGYSIKYGTLNGFSAVLLNRTLPHTSGGLMISIMLVAAFAYFANAHLRIRRELLNLRQLEREFHDQARLEAQD